MRVLLITSILLISVLGFVFIPDISAQVQIDPASVYINDNGNYVPYKLTQDANSATVITKDGSYVFDKTSCSISFYNNTSATGTPVIGSDSYSVLASLGNSGVWNPVSIINNAACNTSITEKSGTVIITGTKSVTGAGIFSINYTKPPMQPLKLTFSATNQNPAWTNYHIGMTETIQIPRFIMLGNQTYDLSQYNNTSLGRTWIANHNSQLIKLTANTRYDMGIGWSNANQITVNWVGGKAYLKIDYTYNTPIISPGQTITVDPSISTDTSANGCSGANCLTASITIGSNSNRLLIVPVSYGAASGDTKKVSGVTWNGVALSHLATAYTSTTHDSKVEVWYLIAPATGAHTATVTFTANPAAYAVDAISLYNVDQTTGISNTTKSVRNGTTNPVTATITPLSVGSWIMAVGRSGSGISSPSNTALWTSVSDGGGAEGGGRSAQYNSSPTIGGSNTLSWTFTPAGGYGWAEIAFEVLSTAHAPTTPTITHVNTLNSTAIKADWSAPTGATWYWLNATLSGGATTHINTTATTLTLNNYTAGSKYTFSLVAANATGKSPSSVTKFNYTKNIAPTSPVISSITTSSSVVTVTNPSGNFSGYKVYLAPASTGVYTLYTTTSTTLNTVSITGLTDDTAYLVKLSTRYAVGTNYTGVSTNSTAASWSTIPNPPSGLAISQSVVNDLHLTWVAPSGLVNPILGYKIERSIDYGITWLTLVPNTGNTAVIYDDTTVATGNTYSYRVSAITISGTSNPTSPVSATVLSSIQLNPTGSGINTYNTTAITLGFSSKARNSSVYDVFPLTSYDSSTRKQSMSWYTGSSGSSTLTKRLGSGLSTLTLSCPLTNTHSTLLASNGTNIYYECDSGSVNHINISTGVNTHDFTVLDPAGAPIVRILFLAQHHIFSFQANVGSAFAYTLSWESGNTTTAYTTGTPTGSNQKLYTANTSGFKFNQNTTSLQTQDSTLCALNYSPTNATISIDNIACDNSIPAMAMRYWNGLMIQKVANYPTDNLQNFLIPTDTDPYKKILTLPCTVLGVDSASCTTFILTDTSTSTDYLIVLTSTHTYYVNALTALSYITNNNYAVQSYYIVPYSETSAFNIPSPLLQSISLYGPSINTTVSKGGLLTLPSGYSIKGTSVASTIRYVDPRWTNDNTDIPLLTTTGTLFPIYLTVSNAPVNSALMVTLPSATINSITGVWTVTALDATRSAEFDIPSGQCGLVYVADISSIPTIWNYEGQVCATGVNQKTIVYINTLPTNFFTLRYGVTDSYTPSTEGLTTSFHTTIPGTVYTVEIKNSTGAIAQSYTFTVPTNATLDTQHYNVSGITKPAGLFVSVGGNQIYSAYLGSPLSLASVATFFHQYLSYQGFDLLSFIPLIFASMFTRNTVGIGAALTVVLIATLSFLSIVVVPEPVIYIGIIIAIIGMIGYRAFGY